MELPLISVSLCLSTISGLLITRHFRSWRKFRDPQSGGARHSRDELDFAYRQFRRRLQCSTMLGIAGGLLFVLAWIESPLSVAIILLAVIGLLLWSMLLATADIIATRVHYSVISNRQQLEGSKLTTELENTIKLHRSANNGHETTDE